MARTSVLVVDVEPGRRKALAGLVEGLGYVAVEASSPEEMTGSVAAGASAAVVALSIHNDSLVETFRTAHDGGAHDGLPVLAILEEGSAGSDERFIRSGFDDVVLWPSPDYVVRARLRSLIRGVMLRSEVGQLVGVLASVVAAVEAREPYRVEHSARVAAIAEALGRVVGLSADETLRLRQAGLLHDIGTVAIPDRIVFKSGPLTREETAVVQSVPVVGSELLRGIPSLEPIRPFVHRHHERLDGSGYPDGLSGREIPLAVQVLSIADAYDALTSSRPYRAVMAHAVAMQTLYGEAARGLWDPSLVEALDRTIRQLGSS